MIQILSGEEHFHLNFYFKTDTTDIVFDIIVYEIHNIGLCP